MGRIPPRGPATFWQIGSWFVANDTSGGQSFYSELVQVNPGDSLTGIMTLQSVDVGGYHYVCEFDGFIQTQRLWTNPKDRLVHRDARGVRHYFLRSVSAG